MVLMNWLWIGFFVVGNVSSVNIPGAEMDALFDLFNATNGAQWEWSDDPADGIPWNFANASLSNPCVDRWQGINCSFPYPYDYYHVNGLGLSSFNLFGTLPDTLDALSELTYLALYYNLITGTVPPSLGNFTKLQYLELFGNQLTGTIPETLTKLTTLLVLDLSTNVLTGTIPMSLGKLTQLNSVFLDNNFIAGEIPFSMGALTQLQYLTLNDNQLTSTIPESFGNFKQMIGLGLQMNQISGTIPACFGNMQPLQFLGLLFNHLTGTIPDTLGYLPQLQILDTDTNHLNGTIPSSLESLSQILDLVLRVNHLSGSIPSSFGNLTQLQFMDVGINRLTGTMPASLGNLVNLKFLYVYTNRIRGQIPDSLGNLANIAVINFEYNYLSGAIPYSIGRCLQLRAFSVDANDLTGSIPVSLGALPQLRYLSLSNNQLQGTIPDILSQHLQHLQLHDNQLSGTIPSLVYSLALQVVLLQNNHLTGTLDSVFDPTTQLQVASIVLNNNQFSGTIPSAVFELKPETFVGTSNCFKGPLPVEAICSNVNLVSFVIDGMSSASSCRNKLFVGSLSAYTLEHAIGGNIPVCIFQLPKLSTLHLSGNGFTGTIPSNIVLSDSFMDLSLSHNALTGSIPDHIQLKKWNNLDLSYNRLSGTLVTGFASNESIEMENNRLSGHIPGLFRTKTNLSMLGSNTFSCAYDQSDLPEHDPDREHYHCGSNSFDILYYIWLGAILSAVAGGCYFEWKHSVLRSILSRDVMLRDSNLYRTLTTVCHLSVRCAIYSVVVLLPLYAICSTRYGTQTYEYAYQVSASYMSGVVPMALYWLFWWILLMSIAAMIMCALSIGSQSRPVSIIPAAHSVRQTMGVLVPYLLIDCIVVVGVNAAYVYVAVYKSNSLLQVVQTLLSIFKIVWGRWALLNLLSALSRHKRNSKIQVYTQIVVNVLNNVIIPCLIVAVVSPNCFYNALVAAPAVTSTVYYKECIVIDAATGERLQSENAPLPTSFGPPFTYNYQCSSSLITYYAPAFVSACIISTFVTPLTQLISQFSLARATVGTYWYRLLDSSLPGIMKPMRDDVEVGATNRPYLGSSGLLTTVVSTLALILTFGVMFPPLCVALAFSTCATVLFFRVNVSRFIHNSVQQLKEKLVEAIITECNSVDSMRVLKSSVWVLITVGCWFYTLFLFDTPGDAVGFEGAYWVLIVMPLMPLVLYVIFIGSSMYYSHVVSMDMLKDLRKNVEVEMQTIGDNYSDVHNVLAMELPSRSGDITTKM